MLLSLLKKIVLLSLYTIIFACSENSSKTISNNFFPGEEWLDNNGVAINPPKKIIKKYSYHLKNLK